LNFNIQSFSKPLILLVCCLFITACNDPAADKKPRKPAEHLVETVNASVQTISVKQNISGTLQAIRVVRIINQVPGLLMALPVYPGDRVKKGQTLVQLDDTVLAAELHKAEATVKQTKVDYRRLKDLSARKMASESEVAQAQTLHEIARADLHLKQTQFDHSKIQAPISGVISQRLVEPGDVIPLHNHLLTLIDTSSLKAEIQLSELLLPLIKPGNSVDISIDALGEQTFQGKIKRIYPVINKDTRRGTIEIVLNPVPKGALAGQFCRVNIHTESKARLMIPYDAVRHDKQSVYVFSLQEGKAKRVNITTGIQQGDFIEVLTGLVDKQEIISKGLFGLKDKMNVTTITR
jgi:membrane fusion protein, multidrug efflux system